MCLWKCLRLKCLSKKNALKKKNMKCIKPFRMFSLLNYHGLNQWLEVMVFLTRCIAMCAWPLKARTNYWQPNWMPCRNMWGEKRPANHLAMVEGTIYYYKNFLQQKMKHCMLPIFITMWFINWIWGKLRRRKRKRFNILLCFPCWGRVIPWWTISPLSIFLLFQTQKHAQDSRSIGLIT